jgi:putative CocE/NonD family hydrolase
MGENTWQSAATWPPTGTTPIKLYFNSNNQLSRDLPTSANDSAVIVYDPRDPSPTVGGSTLRQDLDQGPYDQAPVVEMRNDILTFTTPALSENVVMKGSERVHLFVKSNRPDTDFSIRLTDVYPDGRSMLLADNIQRMRFRNGFRTTDTASMQPNAVYEIDIDIHDLAITFVAGHKIRIDITSANYPRYDNNLNNGGAMYTAGDTLIATNTVFLSNTKASFVELPLISYPSAITDNFATNSPFILYPNPVAETFSITGLDYSEINLYNLSGTKLLSLKRSEYYDLRTLPAGVYFVEVIGDGGVYWRKLVKG